MELDDYRQPGVLTTLSPEQLSLLAALDPAPASLCQAAQGLLILPDLVGEGIAPERFGEKDVRPAAEILRLARSLSDAPLHEPRPVPQRVIGTCRHFAVLACAFLRAQGIAARARCGFATYFEPGRQVDHWITEHWEDASQRWVRIDSEILGFGLVERPDDLTADQFLTGGEAWLAYRNGELDGMSFGVHGTDNWGPAEIVGNLVRDLASLHKVEMLPWDVWGPMDACYEQGVDADTERHMDVVAEACGAEPQELEALYDGLRVPDHMIT